jgi:hypothetical protein
MVSWVGRESWMNTCKLCDSIGILLGLGLGNSTLGGFEMFDPQAQCTLFKRILACSVRPLPICLIASLSRYVSSMLCVIALHCSLPWVLCLLVSLGTALYSLVALLHCSAFPHCLIHMYIVSTLLRFDTSVDNTSVTHVISTSDS